jgi:hypothetical protein
MRSSWLTYRGTRQAIDASHVAHVSLTMSGLNQFRVACVGGVRSDLVRGMWHMQTVAVPGR